MQLTHADITEFKALWRQETGKDISDEEAEQYAQDIIGLVRIVSEGSPQHAPSNPSQS